MEKIIFVRDREDYLLLRFGFKEHLYSCVDNLKAIEQEAIQTKDIYKKLELLKQVQYMAKHLRQIERIVERMHHIFEPYMYLN
mgnify:CR=1 FL=1